MTRARRRGILVGAAVIVALTGTAAFAATRPPSLEAVGPVEIEGAEASAVFQIGNRDIRQVRYADRKVVSYAFTLRNDGRFDVTVGGLAAPDRAATLLRPESLVDAGGQETFEVAAGSQQPVVLRVLMTDCEKLSARAASLVGSIRLDVTGLGIDHNVEVALPEELRTGSAREMFCPLATAKSRPPG